MQTFEENDSTEDSVSSGAEPEVAELNRGETFAGQYEIIECIGVGKSSKVFRVRHKHVFGKELALKVVDRKHLKDEKAYLRFQGEIVASYKINHANVVRCFDCFHQGSLFAYTMELADGGDLKEQLYHQISFPVEKVLPILVQLTSAASAIHEVGLVHRDIKPANILFSSDNVLKVADFGIACNPRGKRITNHGEVIADISYCSPEYVNDGLLDARSDIYAIGLVAYEMVTGKLAFSGDSPMELLMARVNELPTPVRELTPECPEAVEAIIMKALAREPEARYQTAAEMFFALKEVAVSLGIDLGELATAEIKQRSQTIEELESEYQALLEKHALPSTRVPEKNSVVNPGLQNQSTGLQTLPPQLPPQIPSQLPPMLSGRDGGPGFDSALEPLSPQVPTLDPGSSPTLAAPIIRDSQMVAMAEKRMQVARTLMILTGIALVVLTIGVYINADVEDPAVVAETEGQSEVAAKEKKQTTQVASFVKSPEEPTAEMVEALAPQNENTAPAPDTMAYQPPVESAPPVNDIDPSSLLTDDAQDAIAEIVTGPVSPEEEKAKLENVLSQMEELGGAIVEEKVENRTHVVQMGETISDIARQYGVSDRALMKENNIKNPLRLQLGRELKIP